MDALVAGGLFFVVARGYTMATGTEASVRTQVFVSAVLAGSTYVAGLSGETTPAVKALTAGTLFAGTMYTLGNDAVLTHTMLGTLSAYTADVLLTDEKKEVSEETNGD